MTGISQASLYIASNRGQSDYIYIVRAGRMGKSCFACWKLSKHGPLKKRQARVTQARVTQVRPVPLEKVLAFNALYNSALEASI